MTPTKLPNLRALLRQHFFAGVLVVVPLAVSAWIAGVGIHSLWKLHFLLPEHWRPENFLPDPRYVQAVNILFTIGTAIVIALGISLVGWSSRGFLGRKAINLIALVMEHIPVLRSIYSALDQLLKTLTAEGGSQFSRVVYVEYPRKGTWALAFVTGPAKGPNVPANHLNIYVPTTPNPTSGFHLIVSEAEVRESHLSVEQAFRTILSLGLAQPSGPGPRHGG